MQRISVIYTYNYYLNFADNYVFTTCKKCVNLKNGRVIKMVYNNGCLGYNIKGKFYRLTKLKKHLVKYSEPKCHF